MTAAVVPASKGGSNKVAATKDGEKTKKDSNNSSRIDEKLVEKAVSALIKYHKEQAVKKEEERSTRELFGGDRPIQVQFGLEVSPVEPSRKPIRVLIPHPIYQVVSGNDNNDDEGLDEPEVCLIVKEESKPWVQEMILEFKEHMGCVKKVLGLDSLRKKYGRFQQRRDLLQQYNVFMADDRILPMLTKALGKDFVKAKKLPLPIRLSRKEALPFAIQRNLSATYMTVSQGTSIMVRAGNTGMPMKKLVENVIAIAENAVAKIPRKWANIRNIAIKTPESTSLPFYHKLPEELLEIAKMAGVAPAFKDISASNNNIDKGNHDDSPKRKRDLAAKSPLIRALKKQKKEGGEKGQKDKAEKEKPDKTKVAEEEPVKSSTTEKTKSPKDKEPKEEVEKPESNPESNKKKRRQETNGKDEPKSDSKKSKSMDTPKKDEPKSDSKKSKSKDTPKKDEPKTDSKKSKSKDASEKDEPKSDSKKSKSKDAPEKDEPKSDSKNSKSKDTPKKDEPKSDDCKKLKSKDMPEKDEPKSDSKKLKSKDKPKKDEPKSDSKRSKRKDTPEKDEPKSDSKRLKRKDTPEKDEPKSDSKKSRSKDEEKGDFVASKKYKGSKKGYVFRKGEKGLGYYVDVKPVADKMMLAALTRKSGQSGSGQKVKRSKSGGKHRGGRRQTF